MSIITPPQTIFDATKGDAYLFVGRNISTFSVTNVKLNGKSNIIYIPRGTLNVKMELSIYINISTLYTTEFILTGDSAYLLFTSWYIGPVTGKSETPLLSQAISTIYWDDEPFIAGINAYDTSFNVPIPATVPGDVYYITHTYDFNSVPSGTKQFYANSQPIAAIILLDPIFDTLPTRTIYDDTEAGTIVYKININDSFHQNYTNFKIEYSLIEIEDYLSFIIDLATGDVLLLKPQLSRVKSSYTFSINANIIGTYKGAFINYDEILQSIVINNISRQSSGDGTTIVDPIFLRPPPVSISIYDDILPGTLVYGANVYNQEGNPLLFSFTTLTPNVGTDFSNFIINPVSGDVSIITPKSKSDKPSYSFVVKVIDTITKKSALESITITNNERLGPKFYSPTIELNTYEDAPDFTLVYGARVKTQKGSSLQFSFDISGNTATRNININDSSNFIIDSTTGEVRIIKSQSVTSTTAYNFKISVKDTITNLGDTQSLTITNNYGTPYFLDGPSISITVYDDHDLTEKIYTPNLNYTTDLGYTLVNGLFDNDFFTFNNNISGNVFLTKEPYAEGINEYIFQIKATNSINNKYATQKVLVNIKKRPLPPYFTDISYNIQLDDTIQEGEIIYKFIAVSAYENNIKYYIIDDGIAANGDDTQFFNIDINNGSLTFTDLPDKLDYKIKIKVVDIINLESLTSETVEIHLNNIVYFEEGDNTIIVINEKNLENSIIYRPIIKYNSKFINSSNINLNINGTDKDKFTINANSAIHADNVYFSINNSLKISPYNFELVASIPDINLTLKQSVRVIVNFTSCTQTSPDPPNLWSRATLSCVNYDVYSQEEFAMRQKAEVLKYKGNQNPLTKKQQFSRNVNGNGPLGKKVWATQNILGSNPNVFNLPQVGNTLILCPTNDTEDKYFAYTANESSNNVSVYKIDPTTGVLTIIGNYPTGTFPTAVAVNPIKKLVYVANYTSDNISGYTIDSTTGALTSIAGSPFFNGAGTRPQSLRVDPNGNFLYVANYNSANVSGYKIHPSTGALSSISGSPFSAGSGPISVTVSPNGKFVYVANINSNFVSGYTIDPSTGTLTSIGGTFTCGPQSRSVTVDPTGNFVYITNDGTTPKIYGYTINPTTGSLTSMTGSPFNSDSPFSLAVVPNIKFAYVANYNNYFISGYGIDPTTGALTSIGTFSTSTTNLDAVSVDPTGKFVYVTTHYSILGYVINQTTGALTTMTGSPFSNIDARELRRIITVRISDNKTNVKCEPSSSSDVPGNSILCYDPAVPLVNYLPPPRTYLAGGTKWPQYTWKPGDNGFPRGKKGSMNMLFQ